MLPESEPSDEIQITSKIITSMIYIYAVIFVALCFYAIFDHIQETIEEYRLEMTYQSINQEVTGNKNRRFRTINNEKIH